MAVATIVRASDLAYYFKQQLPRACFDVHASVCTAHAIRVHHAACGAARAHWFTSSWQWAGLRVGALPVGSGPGSEHCQCAPPEPKHAPTARAPPHMHATVSASIVTVTRWHSPFSIRTRCWGLLRTGRVRASDGWSPAPAGLSAHPPVAHTPGVRSRPSCPGRRPRRTAMARDACASTPGGGGAPPTTPRASCISGTAAERSGARQ